MVHIAVTSTPRTSHRTSIVSMTSAADPAHTIVLMQATAKPAARQYADYESVPQALESIITQFESTLTKSTNTPPSYDISQLYGYIDGLPDLVCLTFDSALQAYQPHSKQWIKNAIFKLLKKQHQC